ncbi:sulfite exporter TauE/SafE family protein [Marinihelvus fidelis]|uniref:Sulfite exporter TauE/SafE family protein n=1 Tax=Marinihelvus fidelis TaxID=2613842 RepID=A0A5N0TC83_9GAMM|nr:sulfite exporter TauE/SafE family protein [Marinihelvus fidelis]KAA9132570.1 sulfite exporter TauE/SafE family protein [Marinihelvus fidelis]
MSVDILPPLVAALLAGLLGSGHCFGMCGGIAMGLGSLGPGKGQAWRNALLFNLGRLLAYAGLGGVIAATLGQGGEWAGVPGWGRWLRLAAAVLIAVLGLQMLTGWRALAVIERVGAGLWKKVAPLAARTAAWPGPAGRLLLGLCWGFLPCGLVYTALLIAASTGGFARGAGVMAAFGLGTLPSMLGMTLAAPALVTLGRDPFFRRVAGFGLLLLAAWAIVLAWPAGDMAHHHH